MIRTTTAGRLINWQSVVEELNSGLYRDLYRRMFREKVQLVAETYVISNPGDNWNRRTNIGSAEAFI